jgi:hypothetical protein
MWKYPCAILVVSAVLSGTVGVEARAEEPSVKEGLEDVGEAVKTDTKDAAAKAEEGVKRGVDATEHGVGKAMEKTGEGLEKGGERVRQEGD